MAGGFIMICENPDDDTRPVIVPLDATARSAAILPVVRTVLELFDAPACVVPIDPVATSLDQLRRKLPELDRLTISDCGRPAADPAEAIVRAAGEKNGRGIIMALHADPGSDSGLEPFNETVLREMRCPILLIPHERLPAEWRLRRVVLPHDGSPEIGRAIRPAVRLAERARATLLVLHVSGAGKPPQEPGTLTAPHYIDQPQHEWPAWAGEFLERVAALCGKPVDVPMEMFVASGEPGPEVVRFTREHQGDLVVLPWHCCLAPHHALTLRAIMRDPPCPLVMLPAERTGAAGQNGIRGGRRRQNRSL
jgi:nucleotide-binding universal stress UspA family protein